MLSRHCPVVAFTILVPLSICAFVLEPPLRLSLISYRKGFNLNIIKNRAICIIVYKFP